MHFQRNNPLPGGRLPKENFHIPPGNKCMYSRYHGRWKAQQTSDWTLGVSTLDPPLSSHIYVSAK